MSEQKMASGGKGEGQGGGTLKDTIVDELVLLLKDFIWRWLHRRGFGYANVVREALDATELRSPGQQKVSDALQVVGDQVDGDGYLNRLITDPSITPSKDVFVRVVLIIFSDGKINWGRVVSVFYFACILVMKAQENSICSMIRDIITWTIDYFREWLVNWIREQGGWVVAVFLAGVLTALYVMRK